jgi:HlyD family secretion protein
MKKIFPKINWKKIIKWAIVAIIIIIGGTLAYHRVFANKTVPSSIQTVITNSKVEVRDIQNVLSSSGTIEPLNTYEVKTLVEGEVISADFEEGDYVEEGQILYQIATDNLDSKIETAQTTVTRAEENYDKAKDNYEKALTKQQEAEADYKEAAAEYGNTDVTSEISGIVKTLFVKEGDPLQKGSQIAELYDNKSMLLVIPFNAAEVDQSLVGETAEVTIEDSFETIQGKVTKVSSIEEVLTGNRLVKKVTIQVTNPGGITDQTTATASIGDIYSVEQGTFSVLTNTILTSKVSGEIESLKIEEGSSVSEGDMIIKLSEDSINEQLKAYETAITNAEDAVDNAKDNMESASDAIEDAKSSLQDVIDSRTDYSITAPISGQVIRKDSLVGDKVNNTSSLCVIYDLSSVTFSMYVDELDVRKVKEGQEVDITADALEGAEINGIVTNISLESTANQGVTQYPVTVLIEEAGDLLPGMNVTGEVIIEKAEGVLAIPSDALMRGDIVYVADASVTEAVGEVPAGYRSVQVETGITDGNYIEIKSGLTGEEEVYTKRISGSSNSQMGEDMMFDFNMMGQGRNFERPSGTTGNFSGSRNTMQGFPGQ